jgi:peptidyl-tRNA hydrolase, PTH1 family
MKFLIAGLGNMDPDYMDTRHNIGFEVADAIAKKLELGFKTAQYVHYASGKYKGKTVIIIKPTTYMNLSGKALRYWMQKENIAIENTLTILDDLNLSFGTQRLRPGGSDGGHNGLKNITAELNSNQYARLRIGIGNSFHKGQQVNYVLGKWDNTEKKYLADIIQLATDTSLSFCFSGLGNTMNIYNNKKIVIPDSL